MLRRPRPPLPLPLPLPLEKETAIMSDLLSRRLLFTSLVPSLVGHARALGYGATLGEVVRSQAAADWNAAHGLGISTSLHREGLAVDLNLYAKEGLDFRYITDGEGHTVLGPFWKALHPLCAWGGDFTKKDWDHYSVTFQGRR